MTDTTTRQHDALSDPPAPPSSRGLQQQHEVSIKSAATTTVTVTASAAANNNNNKIIIDSNNNNNAPPQCCSDIVNHGSRGTSLGSNHSSQHYDSVSSSSSASSSSSSSGGSQLDDDDAFASDYDGLYEVRRRLGSGNHSDVFLAYWKGGGLLHDRADADKEEEVIASLADTPPPAAEATSTSGINMNAPSGGIEIAVKVTSVLSPHIHRELRCLQHVQRHLRDQAQRLEEGLGSQQKQHECALTPSLPCPQLFFHTLARKEKCGGASTANKHITFVGKRRGGTKRVRSPSGSDAAGCSPSPPLADSAARHILGVELLGPDVFEFTDRFRLTEAEVCWVAMQMLRSLTAVHAASVVHRSVKPENFCFAKVPTTLPPQVEEEGEYPIKLIDYGRGTVAEEGGSRLEEPYTGWWHSLRGFLGQPLGPKDDLLGIVHTVGFILDDYLQDDEDKDGDDHVDGDCVGASERAADADDAVGVSCLDDRPLQRWQRVGDYSCCRRVLSDAIQDALDACRDEERREAKKRPRHEGGGDHHDRHQALVATTRTSSAAEARQFKRQRRVAHIELEVLPGLLPDRYYPDRLPHWWKAWYAVCVQHCSDDQVSAEAMSACMRSTLVERISQGCDNIAAAVDAVGIDVLSLVHRRAP